MVKFIGDLLLSFNCEGYSKVKRSPSLPWIRLTNANTDELVIQESGKNWKGYPFSSIHTPSWDIYLLGELFDISGQNDSWEKLATGIVDGSREAKDLNGHCLLLAWDKSKRCWHFWTNRFGSLHMYYSLHGKRRAIGTFFPAVANQASNRQFDWTGLAGFFSFGFFPQDRTYFEDVRVMRPGSEYVIDENGSLVDQKRYWTWTYLPDTRRSYDDTVAQFHDTIQVVIADQTRDGRIALPISGGLDSRTIASVIGNLPAKYNHNPVWAYSYGYSPSSVETHIARRVAESQDLAYESFTIPPYLFDRLDMVTASLEGFNDITMCRQAAIADEINDHADFILGGHLGDLILDDTGISEKYLGGLSDRDFINVARQKIEKNGGNWFARHLLESHMEGRKVDDLLQEIVQDELKPLMEIEDRDFRLKAFKIEQYCFRFTATGFRMYQPASFPRLPFYDTRLVDLICTIPTDFVRKRRLEVDYLKYYAPELARITWQAFDANLYWYKYYKTLLLPKRVIKKLGRAAAGKPVIQRNWEVQFLSPGGRENLEAHLLHGGLKIHQYAQPAQIGALIKAFYAAPAPGDAYTLSMLLTFAAWLERYG